MGGAVLLGLLVPVGAILSAGGRTPFAGKAPEVGAGQALRAALEARKAGDADHATELLAAVAKQHPVIADYADLLRSTVFLEAGRYPAALAAAQEGETRGKASALLTDLHRAMGDAQAGLADGAGARESWHRALSETSDPARAAALRGRIAESLEASLDPRGAAEVYVELWRDAPTTPEGRRAGERLLVLEPAVGVAVRRPRDWTTRADVLFRNGYSEEALSDLDWALAHGLEAPARPDAAKQRAHCLFRLRRYAEADTAFAALAPDEEATLYRGRSAARGGDVLRGIQELEMLANRASPQWAAQARWYAGQLLDDQGETARAREQFVAVSQQTADPSQVPQALWRLGWSAYGTGDFEGARGWFARLEAAAPDLATRTQARYWSARCMERAGTPEEAQHAYAAIASEFPISYYGWRALSRAPDAQPQPGTVALGSRVLRDAELQRPRILLEAGLDGAASEEVSRLLQWKSADGQSPSLADRVELAGLFARAGDAHLGQSLVVDGFGDALARGAPLGGEEPWHLAWPLAFPESVDGAVAGKDSGLRELVYAIMREESGYRPSVVSPAGARGLLQIMPTTGARLAHQVGIEAFTADDLFRPEANLRLGAAYLDDLMHRFGGRLSAAIGSYNAGPEAVSRWLEERGGLADDEWVESIPYDQTRGYVKRVLRSLHAYRMLYR